MSTLYKSTVYELEYLMKEIKLGNIALPDIQRPFVWKTSRVRDLFDSMYRGYPVGTLMFWETAAEVGSRQIGDDSSGMTIKKLVVDGQQRLTSLYAVIKGEKIVTDTFEKQHIQIAFQPDTKYFRVANATTKSNPEFIPDITVLWQQPFSTVMNDFFTRLNETKAEKEKLSHEDMRRLEDHIHRVQGLQSYNFQVIELAREVDEAEVADIFVRINSEGVKLKQADFILTLMSVHWEEGRRNLERFCREAVNPPVSGMSSKNVFLDPAPDQLLRAGVGLAFRRGKLQRIYSILKGKDLKTGTVSTDQLKEQFDQLKLALKKVLDLNNWHDYLKCIRDAGFMGRHMVTSNNTIVFTYILWLIGKNDFKLKNHALRSVIGRWFFMAHLTGRYSSASETQIESDLRRISDLNSTDGSEFCKELDRVVDTELTRDYWEIHLPNQLDNSSFRTPVLFAYWAALNLLGGRLLFGTQLTKDLLSPAEGVQQAIDSQYLFPKEFLASEGVTDKKWKAIANRAFIEWPKVDGLGRATPTSSPVDYWPEMSDGLDTQVFIEQMRLHALPDNWYRMKYNDFLIKRRELIAAIIREGFKHLSNRQHLPDSHTSIREMIKLGESQKVEFKSTGRYNSSTDPSKAKKGHRLAKTVCGFLNADGGTLLIGVSDKGEVLGLTKDYKTLAGKPNRDGYELWLRECLDNSLSTPTAGIVRIDFERICEHEVCVVIVGEADKAVFAQPFSGDGQPSEFWVRMGNATKRLVGTSMMDYQNRHWR